MSKWINLLWRKKGKMIQAPGVKGAGLKPLTTVLILLVAVVLLAGCGKKNENSTQPVNGTNVSESGDTGEGNVVTPENGENDGTNTTPGQNGNSSSGEQTSAPDVNKEPDLTEATDPESIAVLVNKEFALPDDYDPTDLVYPDVRFTFKEKIEKRMMRKEAAKALEEMFAGAEEDGVYLAGVSAYRSHSRQTTLFNQYVARDGEEKAKTYSAVPGHSEHETGLAIDVSGSDGKCAAEDCFGGTKEANWLADHATEYGFIIRYPDGQESITGYKYEPWHLRYVGKEIAASIAERGITLEEYYDAVPVSGN
ncbi:M15 family metallopeptidase [Paenibacillus segetis]|uniref:Carboxypeptidase YodJ n=1 Tax=Paenibacillus segetis TaxID=1325360 RepID=A0ABQ1YQD5_9BACL|nr:putative carboxypeptidase YodJ [Paenibacillus segetis]